MIKHTFKILNQLEIGPIYNEFCQDQRKKCSIVTQCCIMFKFFVNITGNNKCICLYNMKINIGVSNNRKICLVRHQINGFSRKMISIFSIFLIINLTHFISNHDKINIAQHFTICNFQNMENIKFLILMHNRVECIYKTFSIYMVKILIRNHESILFFFVNICTVKQINRWIVN